MKKSHCFYALILLISLCLCLPGAALAQTPPAEKNVLFVIGNLHGTFNVPIQKYFIAGDEIFLLDSFNVVSHDLGPVGLAVDEANDQFFLSYEASNRIEAFSADDGMNLGTITEGTVSDFAGIVVHQGRGHLYAVDRNQQFVFVYDTTTLTQVDYWILPFGANAWGIDLLGDHLYVTNQSATVRWYDIDTHLEAGSLTQTDFATAIAVTDYPDHIVFTQSHHTDSDTDFRKYDVLSGVQSSVYVGDDTKGVSLNPATGYGYSVTDNKIHIIDLETMTIVNTLTIFWTWVPTDCFAATLDVAGKIVKTCTSHPDGNIYKGDPVTFAINVQNTNGTPIHELPIVDEYDTSQLTFEYAYPPSDDAVNDGVLDWSDLVSQIGQDLAVGETTTITVHFTATEDCGGELEVFGSNEAFMTDVFDDQGNPLPSDTHSVAYTISCKCRTNWDCNDGVACNGQEVCLPDGSCSDPEDICEPGTHCNETIDKCLTTMGMENLWF